MAGKAPVYMEIDGFGAMKKRLAALEELDAPEITIRLGTIARLADTEVARGAPGSMGGKVSTRPAKKLGATITFGTVKHPGAKSMEFGRTQYFRGYVGRRQGSGTKFKSTPGQKARPFVGIKQGDKAMGRLRGPVAREILAGIEDTWNRPVTD